MPPPPDCGECCGDEDCPKGTWCMGEEGDKWCASQFTYMRCRRLVHGPPSDHLNITDTSRTATKGTCELFHAVCTEHE